MTVFALIESAVSSADRRGDYGLAGKRRHTNCFTSLGWWLRYVNVLAIDAVASNSYVRSRHVG